MKRDFFRKYKFYRSFASLIVLSVIVVAVSVYFIQKENLIGPVFFGVGILGLIFMKGFGVEIRQAYPDLVFGFVDNVLLISSAILGGVFGGVPGAILGGVAGNTIADGVSGFFEGYVSEKVTKGKFENKRTALSSSISKITGCIFGAGFILTLFWIVKILI